MTQTSKTMVIMLALGMSALAAYAQDENTNQPPGGFRGPGPGRHHPPAPLIVQALDANHDSIIDADEIANAPAVLRSLDKNGDGQLTPDEYMGRPPGGAPPNDPPGPPPEDQGQSGPPDNGSATPPPAGPRGPHGHRPPQPLIIQALDANHDGIIDADEIANASAALKTLDKRGDGRLTPNEYMGRPPMPPRGGNDNASGPGYPPTGAPDSQDYMGGQPDPGASGGPGGPPDGPQDGPGNNDTAPTPSQDPPSQQ